MRAAVFLTAVKAATPRIGPAREEAGGTASRTGPKGQGRSTLGGSPRLSRLPTIGGARLCATETGAAPSTYAIGPRSSARGLGNGATTERVGVAGTCPTIGSPIAGRSTTRAGTDGSDAVTGGRTTAAGAPAVPDPGAATAAWF